MSALPTNHPSLARVLRGAPRWLQLGAIVVVACMVPLTIKDPAGDFWIDALASAAKGALEGAALLWAASRRELSSPLRQTLRLLGGVAVVSGLLGLVLAIDLYRGSFRLATLLGSRWVFISYALATVALLRYPRRPTRPGAATTLALDLLIATCGLGTLTWTLLRTPFGGGPITPLTASIVATYGVSTIGILVGITLVILRGRAEPSRRAFWWFVAGQASYLAVSIVAQLNQTGLINPHLLDVFYQCGGLPTVIGALLMRTDDARQEDGVPDLTWLPDFNPVLFFTPLAIGAGLLIAVQRDPSPQALPFATALTLVSILLAIRLLRSSRDIVRLAAADAARERRRQEDVTTAVTRLAGGIAHEFNNLMTTVIGSAELGEMTLAPDVPAREEFAAIRAAGTRAAALTRQMLQFSGGQMVRMEHVDLSALVQTVVAEAKLAAAVVDVRFEGHSPVIVRADAQQLTHVVQELFSNALRAMPDGGVLTTTVHSVRRVDALDTTYLAVGPGTYAVLAVQDTGVGIEADALPLIFDPFASFGRASRTAGLGLAAVYGIVAVHRGGIAVESQVGRGTRVEIWLPIAPGD